jgi:hypothetical protein
MITGCSQYLYFLIEIRGRSPATKIQASPIHAVHWIFPRVRMLASIKEAMVATATKTAVHVPWAETAFKPTDVLSIPEAQQKI